ncbi:MAG: outer membrane protein [Chthonomonadaceae bacterium]|nr:outer membrane protein [Chthonomonadaceae bacterium]
MFTRVTSPRLRRRGARFVSFVPSLLVLGTASAAQSPMPPTSQTGLTTLPQGPLQTNRQAPVPGAAGPSQNPYKPLLFSPSLNQIPGRAPNQPLTLQDAVSVALVTNRSLALAGEALLRAEGRVSEERSAYLPTVGIGYSLTQLSTGTSANIGGNTISLTNATQNQLGISASLPIDISGLIRAAVDQAKFQEIATRLDINRTRNQIVLDVKNAFYDVLRAEALLAVAREGLQNAQDRLSDTEKKLAAGVVAPFDVLRSQTDVANAQQQVITANTSISLALAALNSTLGLDVNAPISITATGAVEDPPGVAPPSAFVPPTAPADLPPDNGAPPDAGTIKAPAVIQPPTVVTDPIKLAGDFNSLVQEAIGLRPEILEGDASIAAARKGILLARRSLLPTLGITGGYNYTPDAGGFTPQTSLGQAVVSINFPIFEGGLARAREKQARADVSTAETNRRQFVDEVLLELRQAYLNLLQARDRVAVANRALAQAREAYRLAKVRFDAGVSQAQGVSPLLELSDAQNALTQAENNQVNALYDYNNFRSRLDKAIGRYAFVAGGPGYTAPPSAKTLGKTK